MRQWQGGRPLPLRSAFLPQEPIPQDIPVALRNVGVERTLRFQRTFPKRRLLTKRPFLASYLYFLWRPISLLLNIFSFVPNA